MSQQNIVSVFAVLGELDGPALGLAYASRQFFREGLARSITVYSDDDLLSLLQLVVRLPDIVELPVLRWIDCPVTDLNGSAIRDANCVPHPSLSRAEAINLPLHDNYRLFINDTLDAIEAGRAALLNVILDIDPTIFDCVNVIGLWIDVWKANHRHLRIRLA